MTFRSLICDIETVTVSGKQELQSFVSIGRVSFWIILIFMSYYWYTEKTVPATLFDSWWIILLYNFSKKPIDWVSKNVTVNVGK